VKIIIQGDTYDLFESLAGTTLGTLDVLEQVTKDRGLAITAGRVRSYLTEDLFKNTEPFGHVSTLEKRLAFQSLIFLVWRAAGRELTFDDAANVPLSEVAIRIEQEDAEPDPKEPTGSAPDEGDEPAN